MRTKPKISRALAGLPVAVLAAIALPAAAIAPPAAAAARAPSLPTITITMTGKAITVGGTLLSGGTRIVSKVSGEPFGAPALIRLDPGVTLAQFFKLLAGSGAADPNVLDGVAAIVVDAQANHGTSWVQASLAAGQYLAFDTVGPNPAHWPFTPFVIGKAAHPAKLPAPEATIAAIDFGFRGPGRLHVGELVRFVNDGFLVHMIVALQAPDAATAGRIARLLHQGKDKVAGHLAIGFANFAGPLSHSGAQQLTVGAKPGYWVLACFMNTQDGREHTVLGMERVIKIVG